MNNIQKQFTNLLSQSIRNEGVIKRYDGVDFEEIINLAKSHKVEGIIYPILNNSDLALEIEVKQLKELKKIVFNTGVSQIRGINNLSSILTHFNDEEIPVIVLKGLVVRNFYPRPEQRSMCDADILIHKKDLEKVKSLLIKLGYILDKHEASHHIKFIHHFYPVIEVHWHIIKRDGFSVDIDNFERMLWDEAIKVKIGRSEVLSLGYEDLALHLCMHMAAHLASSGFGLRQLCDLVLLVEKKGKSINWDSFLVKAKIYGFERFSIVMFVLCKKLFNMDIPKELNIKNMNKDKYIDALIDEIFEAGVHGKKDMINNFGNQIAFNFEKKDNNAVLGAIKRFLLFIFPHSSNMGKKYDYAKGNRILIPIAWGHHLLSGIFRNDYKIKDKIKFITSGVGISVKKNKLLQWLEL